MERPSQTMPQRPDLLAPTAAVGRRGHLDRSLAAVAGRVEPPRVVAVGRDLLGRQLRGCQKGGRRCGKNQAREGDKVDGTGRWPGHSSGSATQERFAGRGLAGGKHARASEGFPAGGGDGHVRNPSASSPIEPTTPIRCGSGCTSVASSCWFRTGGIESAGGGKTEESYGAIADDGKSSGHLPGCKRFVGSSSVTTAFSASIKASSTSLA